MVLRPRIWHPPKLDFPEVFQETYLSRNVTNAAQCSQLALARKRREATHNSHISNENETKPAMARAAEQKQESASQDLWPILEAACSPVLTRITSPACVEMDEELPLRDAIIVQPGLSMPDEKIGNERSEGREKSETKRRI